MNAPQTLITAHYWRPAQTTWVATVASVELVTKETVSYVLVSDGKDFSTFFTNVQEIWNFGMYFP